MKISIEDIKKARESIQDVIRETEVEKSFSLSKLLNAEIFVKTENQQFTGSFKLRGAYNKISHLTEAEKKKESSLARPAIMPRVLRSVRRKLELPQPSSCR